MTRTFLDAGVLIAAIRGASELADRAMELINDPERLFVSSAFVQLEVLPKAFDYRQMAEVSCYRASFASVAERVPVSQSQLPRGCMRYHHDEGGEEPVSTKPKQDKWKYDGVRVVKGSELDTNTPQTPGMHRAAAITYARCGAEKLWAGTVVIHPNAKTGAHHHGPVESVIYVVSGKARMRWGEQLEFVAEAGPGDFIHVPPYVPHQEMNASANEPLSCVLCRSGQEPVVVNLDIPVAEHPEQVYWVDNIHPHPHTGQSV